METRETDKEFVAFVMRHFMHFFSDRIPPVIYVSVVFLFLGGELSQHVVQIKNATQEHMIALKCMGAACIDGPGRFSIQTRRLWVLFENYCLENRYEEEKAWFDGLFGKKLNWTIPTTKDFFPHGQNVFEQMECGEWYTSPIFVDLRNGN